MKLTKQFIKMKTRTKCLFSVKSTKQAFFKGFSLVKQGSEAQIQSQLSSESPWPDPWCRKNIFPSELIVINHTKDPKSQIAKIQAHFSIAEMGQVVGQNEKDQKTKSIAPSLKWGK